VQTLFLLPQFPFNALTLLLPIIGGTSPRRRSFGGVETATRRLQLVDELFFALGFVVHRCAAALNGGCSAARKIADSGRQ
jgi:hypothetical protein